MKRTATAAALFAAAFTWSCARTDIKLKKYTPDAGAGTSDVIVSVSPPSVTLRAGTTQRFTATVNGAGVGVIWSVRGTGTIDKTGLYTAPRKVPAVGDVVMATSATKSSAQGQAQVAIAAGAASKLEIVSGDGQFAVAGNALAKPLTVRLTDPFGNPSIDGFVSFDWRGHNAVITYPRQPNSDGTAAATVNFSLLAAGKISITVTATFASGSPATARFTETAVVPGQPAVIAVSGDGQTATAGTALSSPLVVVVVDENGAPVAGASVDFSSPDNGSCVPETVVTDATGMAQTSCTLGPAAGAQTFVAESSPVYTPVTFDATATVAGKASLSLLSGDGQTAAAGAALANPLSVIARTADGSPAPNVPVQFEGPGNCVATAPATGADGTVSATCTLALSAGIQQFTATSAGLSGSPVTFNEKATPVSAATIAAVSGFGQHAAPGNSLPNPLVVAVVDASGAPVPGVSVAFAGPSGTICGPNNVQTAVDGTASTSCFVGTAPGLEVFTATAPGFAGSPVVFNETVDLPGCTLSIVSGDNQSGTAGQLLPQPLVVNATCDPGTPVPGAVITFSSDDGRSVTATTRADGTASVSAHADTKAGPITFTASSDAFSNSPITFHATAVADVATQIFAKSGSGQSAPVGSALPAPLVVLLSDQYGNPVPGVNVSWATADSGSCAASATTTGADGFASVICTVGPKVGTQVFNASVRGLQGSPIVFKELATATGPGKLSIVSGDNQSGAVALPLPNPLVVKATDAFGNPSAGVVVTFAGGNGCAPASTTAGADGIASSNCTSGNTASAQTFTASATGLSGSPLTFHATATAGKAALLTEVSGSGQKANIKTRLATPLVVFAADKFNNPVAGVTVAWATQDDGSCAPSSALTGADGKASSSCTTGSQAGTEIFTASADGLFGSPLLFQEFLFAGGPAQIIPFSGGGQTGVVNTAVQPITAHVIDAGGNPVAGVTVTFTQQNGGSAQPGSIATDNSGNAQANITLGTRAGQQTFNATVAGLPSAGFIETATPDTAAKVNVVSGDGQLGTTNTKLGGPFVVAVVDQYGNAVSGAIVSFTPQNGGSVNPVTMATGADGQASTQATLGNSAGSYSFTAAVRGATSNFLSATAKLPVCVQVKAFSGAGQSGIGGSQLGASLVTQAQDCNTGAPLANITVYFFAPSAGGSVIPTSGISGPDGKVQTSATLPGAAGTYFFTASISGDATSPVSFQETVSGGAAARLVGISGDQQSGPPSSPLSAPLVVQVVDAAGNPVAGTTVTFSTQSGGSVAPDSGTSGSDGKVSAGGILGGVAGKQVFTASAAGLNSIDFTETATAGIANALKIVSGNDQTSTVGWYLPLPLVVEVVDSAGNPVAGVTVSLTGPSVTFLSPLVTGGDGQASFEPVAIGTTVGTNSFTAASNGLASVVFTETGTPDFAAKIIVVRGDGQSGAIGTRLANPLVAKVEDFYGNVVPGSVVTFAAIGGGGSVSPASGTTDAAGEVSTTATLGPSAGTDSFAAASLDSGASAIFHATATATAVSLTVAPFNTHLAAGYTLQYTATENFNDGSTLDVTSGATWSTSNGTLATVSTSGLVTASGVGNVNVTAAFSGLSGTVPLQVTNAKLTSLAVTPLAPQLGVGTTLQLFAVGTFSDGTKRDLTGQAAWSSNAAGVASVTAGLISGVSKGSANISATLSGISQAVSATVTAAAISQIQVSPGIFYLVAGTQRQIACLATYADGSIQNCTSSATWSTVDTNAATVGPSGLVVAVAAGATDITATFNGLSGTANVTVQPATVVSVVMRPAAPVDGLPVGTQQRETLTATFSDGSTQDVSQFSSWTSTLSDSKTDGSSIASVTDSGTKGIVTGQSAGVAIIKATFSGLSSQVTFTVNSNKIACPPGSTQCFYGVANVANCGQGAACNRFNSAPCTYPSGNQAPFRLGMTAQLRACAVFVPPGGRGNNFQVLDLTGQSTFFSDDSGIAAALASPVGMIQATATSSNQMPWANITSQYGSTNSAQGVTVTVDDSPLNSITVNCSPSSIAMGTVGTCTATGFYADDPSGQDITPWATFVSSDTTIVTVSNAAGTNGQVTGVKDGSATITSLFRGVASPATNVTVSFAFLDSIAVAPPSNNAVFSMRQRPAQTQFTAIGLYSDGTQTDITTLVYWTSDNPNVATISNGSTAPPAGLVRFVATGTAGIHADYQGASGTSTITLTR